MTYGEDLYKISQESNKKKLENISQIQSQGMQQLANPNGTFFNDIKKR